MDDVSRRESLRIKSHNAPKYIIALVVNFPVFIDCPGLNVISFHLEVRGVSADFGVVRFASMQDKQFHIYASPSSLLSAELVLRRSRGPGRVQFLKSRFSKI